MKITNPTSNEISIQYKGVVYSIPANESIETPIDVATYWKTMIHQFIIIGDETIVISPVEKEIIPVVVPEVLEVIPVKKEIEEVVIKPKK